MELLCELGDELLRVIKWFVYTFSVWNSKIENTNPERNKKYEQIILPYCEHERQLVEYTTTRHEKSQRIKPRKCRQFYQCDFFLLPILREWK